MEEEELTVPLAEADGYASNTVSDNVDEVLPWYRKYCSKRCWAISVGVGFVAIIWLSLVVGLPGK
jgi:hypothetical protein